MRCFVKLCLYLAIFLLGVKRGMRLVLLTFVICADVAVLERGAAADYQSGSAVEILRQIDVFLSEQGFIPAFSFIDCDLI